MAGAIELRGGTKAGGAGADNRHFFPGANGRSFRSNPAFLPAFIRDGTFDVLDRNRRGVDAENTRAFAGRGTNTARELREVVRFVKTIQRFFPEAAINEIVP